ncbi:relaxase domain-containing protein [Streptomyces sp. NPDC056638]|uniref:relaxase domain-containing protein n=1 Tax=Streptomyces sp. NPDC056638 TaxID=3345887 RepID=UPI0036BCB5C0
MLSQKKISPRGWPYYCNGVMVGDGYRPAGKPLRAAQDEAGVPAGFWRGRGLAAVGLVAGDVVTERQAELLLGEGQHPDADRIERKLLQKGKARLRPGGRPCWAGPSGTTNRQRPKRRRNDRPGWPWT